MWSHPNDLGHPRLIACCGPLEALTDIDVASKQHVIASPYIILSSDAGLSCRHNAQGSWDVEP